MEAVRLRMAAVSEVKWENETAIPCRALVPCAQIPARDPASIGSKGASPRQSEHLSSFPWCLGRGRAEGHREITPSMLDASS